ncbi:complement C1q tumor necrosis factor-related protein 1-like [Chiloscyllium plagiosum]|uniref:complement C1q tumor necrosis factor-related protein 1-like n=1 Tax=Chiloscyllium plagiosum TaxID=36176 RepID=UPI001CB877EB|nr:complement C1q tumor necrosis factor-related protein 1-like [Chiloscyllium plagiosum]
MVTRRLLGHVLIFICLTPTTGAPSIENIEEESSTQDRCVRCCNPHEYPMHPTTTPNPVPGQHHSGYYPPYPMPHIHPHINITILKGDKGEKGERGPHGKHGKEGPIGIQGPMGHKGERGLAGIPGDSYKQHYSAFSVGRKKGLHSSDYYQTLLFDTTFVNLYGHFNMFKGKFYCYVPGIYYFNLNIHTWNFKETYLHIMKNDQDMVICYAQPSDRSIMQSQSIMLELQENDEVWVRLYKRERENAVYSDDVDIYVTFNGYLIKPNLD